MSGVSAARRPDRSGCKECIQACKLLHLQMTFDPTLSFADKIVTWRERPTTSVQLVTMMIMLSLLAVAVVSMG